jgi:uncharacterized protein (TIGR01777 family)
MRVAIAGASGLIGTELTRALEERGDEVLKLPRYRSAPWSIEGVDAAVNLAGANINAKRWTEAYKCEIRDSRVLTARALAGLKPGVLIQASAVGYYGGRGDEVLDEGTAPGHDFLSSVVAGAEAEAARGPGRSVFLRTGIVLSARGGALQQMLLPFKAFVGGPIGSGRQWFPWIHIADEVAAILRCLDHGHLSGPVNLVAPGIVTMKEFARALGRALHRPALLPVPATPLRFLLGEVADVVVEGQRVAPKKLLDDGFQFRFAALDAALTNLLA